MRLRLPSLGSLRTQRRLRQQQQRSAVAAAAAYLNSLMVFADGGSWVASAGSSSSK